MGRKVSHPTTATEVGTFGQRNVGGGLSQFRTRFVGGDIETSPSVDTLNQPPGRKRCVCGSTLGHHIRRFIARPLVGSALMPSPPITRGRNRVIPYPYRGIAPLPTDRFVAPGCHLVSHGTAVGLDSSIQVCSSLFHHPHVEVSNRRSAFCILNSIQISKLSTQGEAACTARLWRKEAKIRLSVSDGSPLHHKNISYEVYNAGRLDCDFARQANQNTAKRVSAIDLAHRARKA